MRAFLDALVKRMGMSLLATSLVAAACTSGSITERSGAGSGEENLIEVPPLSDLHVQEVPKDASKAAARLARVAVEEGDPAAVLGILERAGIPVIYARTGGLAVQPASPSFIDAELYDFGVYTMADALGDGVEVSLAGFALLLSDASGVRLRPDVLARTIGGWTRRAEGDSSVAFGAFAVRELWRVRGVDPARLNRTTGVDPLQMALISASALSRLGEVRGIELTGASTGRVSASQLPSCENAEELEDPAGARSKFAEASLHKAIARDVPGGKGIVTGASALSNLSDLLMAGLLINAVKIDVTNDTDGRKLHYRHREGEGSPKANFAYVATVRWESEYNDVVIPCGPFSYVYLPPNKVLPDIPVKWEVSGGKHAYTKDLASSNKLARGGGGGDKTDGRGQSKLEMVTAQEPECASGAKTCGEGTERLGVLRGTARVDLTTEPPLKVADLLGIALTGEVGEGLLKVITHMIKELSAANDTDALSIRYHRPDDYRVHYQRSGVTIEGTKCGGAQGEWILKVSGAARGAEISGEIVMNIGEDLTGTAVGSVEMDAGFFSIGVDIDFQARAKVDVRSGKVVFTGGSGSGDIHAGGETIGLMPGAGGKSSLPLQPAGEICSSD